MSESQKYSIVIAGRPYPLLVSEEEVEALKELETGISASINELQIKYQHLDKQDCLAMTLIQMALDTTKDKSNPDTLNTLDKKIEAIEKLLVSV